jgi:hypothetical protein
MPDDQMDEDHAAGDDAGSSSSRLSFLNDADGMDAGGVTVAIEHLARADHVIDQLGEVIDFRIAALQRGGRPEIAQKCT